MGKGDGGTPDRFTQNGKIKKGPNQIILKNAFKLRSNRVVDFYDIFLQNFKNLFNIFEVVPPPPPGRLPQKGPALPLPTYDMFPDFFIVSLKI